jgi:SAM-dependent methyltransferase
MPATEGPFDAHDFDRLFSGNDDPWHFRSRWYEARKRALTLACLPAPRYANAYEPGCANGELSAALATRCERLRVSDGSAQAVALARCRLSGVTHVDVVQEWVPDEWPEARFDLVVLSELGYFLDAAALDRLIDRVSATLHPGGTVLACHWRRRGDGCELDGDAVHGRIGARLKLPHLLQTLDADLRIDVWCQDPRSVATREGFA